MSTNTRLPRTGAAQVALSLRVRGQGWRSRVAQGRDRGDRLNQFAGREYAFGRAMYCNRVFALPDLLGSGVYIGGSAEVGMMRSRYDGLPTPGTLFSGSVFVGADTFAGPAYLGAGFGNAGAFSVYLLLGAP